MNSSAKAPLVGVVGPLSGPRAAYGELLRAAAAGSGLALCWEDDAADPHSARLAAERLVGQGVCAVVGHFNSECARVAGPIYRAAGIPLLLPAATAPDLCQVTGAYRLCASEDQQVAALAAFLAEHGGPLQALWSDGSVYGQRLAAALRAASRGVAAVAAGPAPLALMGAHHAVAREICAAPRRDALYLVPDDCVIEEFATLLHGSGVTTLCPHATPDFSQCVGLALRFVAEALAQGQAVGDYLHGHADFDQRQYRHAGFTLVRREHEACANHFSGT